MLLFFLPIAAAEPAADPTLLLTTRALRQQGAVVFLGAPDRSLLQQAWWLQDMEITPLLREVLRPELAAVAGEDATVVLRVGGGVAAGSQTPEYRSGDAEPGLLSLRAWGDVRYYPRFFELAARPVLALDGTSADAMLPELWAGVRTERLSAGAGLRDRFVGPGRHGALTLTDNARPAPMASVSGVVGPWGKLGHFRAEAGAGWLDAPRDDVAHPGWLMMDLRWLPSPWFEAGLSRVGIFWGEDRPRPPLGQLILPTDPHVYGDPDREEPDQDELAALDLRATLPLHKLGLKGETLELWWQYGGEDVIARRSMGIPYPALAGVANLYGGEVQVADWSLVVEGTRALDDYFRWYTGHRVYHDGFTQEGRVMGYAPGGDTLGLWAGLTWLPGPFGGQVYGEKITRVGVVEALGDNLLALQVDEHHLRVGGVGWWWDGQGWWRLEASLEQVDGVGFVAQEETRWRVAVGRDVR